MRHFRRIFRARFDYTQIGQSVGVMDVGWASKRPITNLTDTGEHDVGLSVQAYPNGQA
jgi:hypothetical protein